MYKIRFQNVGTYEAANVYVTSELPEGVQISSFEMISQSHNCSYSMNDGTIDWVFRNINLPDSLRNEPESHGYVMYRLVVDRNAMTNQQIVGQASIVFDFEAPIVTNQVVHQVINATKKPGKLKVWPNPVQTGTEITFAAKRDLDGFFPILKQVQLSSAEGKMMLQREVNGTKVKLTLYNIQAGSYILTATDLEGTQHRSVLIVQ